MKILGIETSCDETAVAVIDMAAPMVLANQIYSQYTEHEAYGGVVPELASRAHLERLPSLVEAALADAKLTWKNIDGIAATVGPGLLGGLLIGSSFAKSLSMATGKPFIGVNHLEGHALTAHLTENIDFPYLLLLVSGGHCQFVKVSGVGQYQEIGSTLDDAIGECFDKVAKMLSLPHPGGPNLEKMAANGNAKRFKLPIALNDGSANFSFSGLKTAVRNLIAAQQKLDEQTIADICASFQLTVAKTLAKKAKIALEVAQAKQFVLAGGVAANKLLRHHLEQVCGENGAAFIAPPINLCTDNAVMIAYAGGLRLVDGQQDPLTTACKPRWPLAEL